MHSKSAKALLSSTLGTGFVIDMGGSSKELFALTGLDGQNGHGIQSQYELNAEGELNFEVHTCL